MPPKSKTAAKKRVTSKSKTSSGSATTNKLLKQLINQVGGGSQPVQRKHMYVPDDPYASRYGVTAPPNGNGTLEYYAANDGVDFARINCPAGQVADYVERKCTAKPMYNGPCFKGQVRDPITGQCTSINNYKPQLGWDWDGRSRSFFNKGIALPRRDGFSQLDQRIPTWQSVEDKEGKNRIVGVPTTIPSWYINKYGNPQPQERPEDQNIRYTI
jgi:hypothetical protein